MVKPELTALEHLEGCRKHPASQCSSMPKRPHQNKTHCGCVDCVDGGHVDSSSHSLQNIGWLPLADTCQTACPKGTLAMDTDLICNSKNIQKQNSQSSYLRIFDLLPAFGSHESPTAEARREPSAPSKLHRKLGTPYDEPPNIYVQCVCVRARAAAHHPTFQQHQAAP